MMTKALFRLAGLLLLIGMSMSAKGSEKVTMESLLKEMVSFEAAAEYPAPFYICKMISSYDRRTVAPDKDGWFANDDGGGYMRVDTIDGRVERVLFDYDGPGAITRIWMTTPFKNGVVRFYFDGEKNPRFEIQGYDMMRAPFKPGDALSLTHTNYTPEGKGGNTFMLPIPYNKNCRITVQEPNPDRGTWIQRYYEINYRTYDKGTEVETFTVDKVNRLQDQLKEVNEALWTPPTFRKGTKQEVAHWIDPTKLLTMDLPQGSQAIRTLEIDAKIDRGDYSKMMRRLILKITFDGVETVWVPLGDFSGAGLGAPKMASWYMDADGRGHVISRWVMPYKKNARIEIENLFDFPAHVKVRTYSDEWTWTQNTLYFHTTWKQEREIPINNQYDRDKENIVWNYIDIQGRGVFRGDLLSLYNFAPNWYGEGDEIMWIDDDVFPSHHGTGTEDHYNCSWAPVVPFHTPWGGAPRADNPTSHGFNAFVRTRNLDGIPFNKRYCFDIEMLSWTPGKVDYAVTNYWYGDLDCKVKKSSGKDEVLAPLPYLL